MKERESANEKRKEEKNDMGKDVDGWNGLGKERKVIFFGARKR